MAIAVEWLHRITTDVYERMAASGLLPERGVELVDGLVVKMSPKGDRHGYAVDSLNAQFGDQRRGRYAVSADSLSLRLGPRDEPEPDIALARALRSYARERPRPNEIALIVEVADSSLAFDLGEKRAKYAGAAIPEYWVVDLKEDVVHVFRNPRGEVYLERLTAKPGDVISPAEYPDVAIDVALVLGGLRRTQ
jgi:Uma2 family endonuclease